MLCWQQFHVSTPSAPQTSLCPEPPGQQHPCNNNTVQNKLKGSSDFNLKLERKWKQVELLYFQQFHLLKIQHFKQRAQLILGNTDSANRVCTNATSRRLLGCLNNFTLLLFCFERLPDLIPSLSVRPGTLQRRQSASAMSELLGITLRRN